MFENLLLAIPYQLMMIYGILTLVSYWAAGDTREIGEPLYLVFGVALPVAGWGMTFFAPPFSLLTPLSVGFLYALGRRRQHHDDKRLLRRWERDLADAERMIEADPQNAAAVWAKAKLLESRGRFDSALDYYERAHALSSRTVTAHELEEIRFRVESARAREKASTGGAGRFLEWSFLAAGLATLPHNWIMGLNLCGLMIFLSWFRGRS